jgi:hexosaminidase
MDRAQFAAKRTTVYHMDVSCLIRETGQPQGMRVTLTALPVEIGAGLVLPRNLCPKVTTMKKSMFAVIVVLGMVLSSICSFARAAPSDAPTLLPLPLEIKWDSGKFELKPNTTIIVDNNSADAMNVGKQLAERLRASTGMDLKVSTTDSDGKQPGVIRITSHNADASLGSEGYRLEIAPDGIVITGGGGAGMFYGMQTLLQLMPPQVFSPAKSEEPVTWTVPAVRIKDQPRFRWRGLLLDVARHFFNKLEVENYLDLMAQQKLNTLHLHLSDDQGWRIEIKRYPKLTAEAAWRKGINFRLNPKDSTAFGKDGRYGGFYTQDDIRELVAYAQARYITIVPEIEMPGHSVAALSVYPEFSCFGGPFDRDKTTMCVFCAGNDGTFNFLQNILTEIIELFPSKYIHIGGDEAERSAWIKCPKCQERLKHENLKNVAELQSYFIKRMEKFINQQHRTLIGWDEILEGGLAPNATVMSWTGIEGGIVAANTGHDAVMTPAESCYLDYAQAKTGEPRPSAHFLPLLQVYKYEPLPQEIPAEKAKHIIGAGANLWTERVPNYARVQYMTYPRACAIAEITWTDPRLKNWEDFKRRLDTHFERLKAQDVNYRVPRKDDAGY